MTNVIIFCSSVRGMQNFKNYRTICLCGIGHLCTSAGRVRARTGLRFFHGTTLDTAYPISIFVTAHGIRDTGYGIRDFTFVHGTRGKT